MKFTDYHVHTCYSPDSEASIKEYLIQAKKLELEYVVFTDHIDMGSVQTEFQEHIDYDEYFRTMKRYELEYKMPIKIGVEIGLKSLFLEYII